MRNPSVAPLRTEAEDYGDTDGEDGDHCQCGQNQQFEGDHAALREYHAGADTG